MKTKYTSGTGKILAAALCLSLMGGVADAKPDKDKDKGKGKGGPPGHSENGKKGKKDHKGHAKAEKDFRKAVEKERKDFEKQRKEVGKAEEKFEKKVEEWREKRFRDDDRNSVIGYFGKYSDKENGLPPGLAKNLRRGKPLPPGWQKKVSRGYVIEDDYRGYFDPISDGVFPGLEVIPDTRLYRYGDRIVRVYEPRREVIDMIVVPTIRLD